MKAIKFPGHNTIYGKDQPQYNPLPALLIPGPHGEVITCWQLSDEEIEELKNNKCIYLSQLTFNGPLQPIRLAVDLSDHYEITSE